MVATSVQNGFQQGDQIQIEYKRSCKCQYLHIYSVNLRIQSEYGKIRTRNNSEYGHFLHNVLIQCDYGKIWTRKTLFGFFTPEGKGCSLYHS